MKLPCLHCGREFKVSSGQLGKQVVCPHCNEVVSVPSAVGNDELHGPRPSRFSGILSSGASGLASLVIHMGLAVVLALATCNYHSGMGEGEEVMIGEIAAEDLTNNASNQLDSKEAEAKAEKNEAELTELETPEPPDAIGDVSVEVDITQFAPGGAGGGGADIGAVGGGGALGAGASFMGVSAKGTRFCIIADCSGSMNGPKLRHVKEEILETLTGMKGRERFQLVFFNSSARPFPEQGWRHPKRDRTAAEQWLTGITAGGGTYPTPAFRVAFGLSPRPDAIFFMTDGLFPDTVVKEVTALNRSGKTVTIHAISFMDKSAEALMRKIAADSGGKYRHVSGF